MVGIMRGELGNMQGLVETFSGAQADASKKIAGMKDTFQEQLKAVQQQGEAKSAELSGKLKRVEENAADLVSEFRQDTTASQKELQTTQDRLDKVVKSTMGQMDGFHTKLAEVQKSRQDEAEKLHKEVDGVKSSLSEQMQHTASQLQQIKQESEDAYKQ